MTDEAMRIAIAEAHLGIKWVADKGWWLKPGDRRPPDYCNDLNAMHEAEKLLGFKKAVRFRIELMYNSDGPKATFSTVEEALCHATACQRAEAFLKAIGKWEES